MEPETTAHKVFSLPELIPLVSTHLSSRDLAQCTLVCKEWLQHFEPALWTNFSPHIHKFAKFMRARPPVEAALIRNLRHIRRLDGMIEEALLEVLAHGLPLQHSDDFEDPGTLCTNLREIDVQSFCSGHFDIFAQHLGRLLYHNNRLTHLTVSYIVLGEDHTIISTLRHLQHLTVFFLNDYEESENMRKILQDCLHLPELTELRFIDAQVLWDEDDTTTDTLHLETIIKEATIARFAQNPTAKKIRSLKFPGIVGAVRDPLPLLLLRSDLLDLESCDIPFFGPEVDIDEIERVVREHCPNLKHLECPYLNEPVVLAAYAFIRGCSGLKSFSLSNLRDSPDYDPRPIISELVSRHHSTLENFELTGVDQVFSRDLQRILSSCQQLRRFWGTAVIVASDIFVSDWVCLELRELSFVLNLRPTNDDLWDDMGAKTAWEWNEDTVNPGPRAIITTIRGKAVGWKDDDIDDYKPIVALATQRVYIQIGRLEKLQKLTLNVDTSDETWQSTSDYAHNLTLSEGWLGELAGLKDLRTLGLKADFWSAMGQAEVEFIYERWPLLSEIAFHCDISEIHAMPHWQWLLNKLPQLRFVSTLVVRGTDSDFSFDTDED